jgi:hexosaminidase
MAPALFSTMILPQPTRLVRTEGCWATRQRVGSGARARLNISATPLAEIGPQAELLAGYLREENQVEAEVLPAAGGDIRLALTLSPRPLSEGLMRAGFDDETHRISVWAEYILIEGASATGIARGIQSLRQLLSGQRARLAIPCMIVDDTPALGWRGLHLDVSRHFRDAADVMRFIDLAAYHKFNLFHWHLTDDQGWRIPIEGYPRLVEIAAWRDGTMIGHNSTAAQNPGDGVRHGGAYTVEEIPRAGCMCCPRWMCPGTCRPS